MGKNKLESKDHHVDLSRLDVDSPFVKTDQLIRMRVEDLSPA